MPIAMQNPQIFNLLYTAVRPRKTAIYTFEKLIFEKWFQWLLVICELILRWSTNQSTDRCSSIFKVQNLIQWQYYGFLLNKNAKFHMHCISQCDFMAWHGTPPFKVGFARFKLIWRRPYFLSFRHAGNDNVGWLPSGDICCLHMTCNHSLGKFIH